MSLIKVREIFDELTEENRRLLNELLFAERRLKCLTEFKSFVDLIFNKINVYLEENDISKYREFESRYETISLENVGNESEVTPEVSDNNCDNDYQQSGQSLNHCIVQSIESLPPKRNTITRKSFQCKTCHKKLISKRSLHYHMKTQHDNMNFMFGSYLLKQSTSKTDSESTLDVEKTSDGQFKCQIDDCDQEFDSEDTIENRFKEHEIIGHYVDQKSRKGQKWYRLDGHSNNDDNNIKLFVCSEAGCQFRSAYKGSLEIHVKRHKDPESFRKYACNWSECQFVTDRNSSLKRHVRVHTNDRPFECELPRCGRRFKTIDHINQQTESHSKEKNVICRCGRRFKTRASMYGHKKHYHFKLSK